ncbi:MAG: hypothetical protein ACFE9Q_12410 [Candidatus Hodarchaeota archaeon]
MDATEFIKKLNEVQELMRQENYKQAIALIEKLKELEKKDNFDYNLIHRLYQLDSNSRSLNNQQILLKIMKDLSSENDHISFYELNKILKKNHELDLNEHILKREIEILILRNLLTCRIDGDTLIF